MMRQGDDADLYESFAREGVNVVPSSFAPSSEEFLSKSFARICDSSTIEGAFFFISTPRCSDRRCTGNFC
jgi:hypothetical protein